MIETKNKKLLYDLEQYRKNPKNYKEYDNRKFFNKFSIIIFYPIILMAVLSFLLSLALYDTVSVYIIMVTTYLLSMYFCLIEYFTFNKLFIKFPDFAYVYIKTQTDSETKKDIVYTKDVQKFYNLIAKSKSIARYRVKNKLLYGFLLSFLLFLIIGFMEPSSMPLFWGVVILALLYILIDFVMMFFGKSDKL